MALEKVVSLSFFETNILPNIFLPDLMALKSWNYDSNSLIYDARIYMTNHLKLGQIILKNQVLKRVLKFFQKKHTRIRGK